jgi:hypothetical protein
MVEEPASWPGVADELPHLDAWTGDLWENHGWCLRLTASDTGTDYLLWVAFYIIRGTPNGRFTVRDVRVAQAVAVEAPAGAGLTDSPFQVAGVHWSEYGPADALAWESRDGAAVWRMAGREHISAPPVWRVRGPADPYRLDLELDALAPVSRFDGFDLIIGYEALARVTGTIEDAEGVHPVRGFGQHEKVHTGTAIQRTDRAGFATLPVERRHMWHCFVGERLALTLLVNQPGEQPDRINGHLVVDGTGVRFGRDDLHVEEGDQWLDPRSGVTVPTGWRVSVRTEAGLLELTAAARARAYYLWDYLKGSTSLLYWFLCDAEARWSSSSGDVVAESGVPHVGHTNRPFLYWP